MNAFTHAMESVLMATALCMRRMNGYVYAWKRDRATVPPDVHYHTAPQEAILVSACAGQRVPGHELICSKGMVPGAAPE